MNNRRFNRWAVAVLMGCAALAASAQDVVGAGATFPAKVYGQWAEQFARTHGYSVQYNPVGSGQGVKQITGRAVDFGATDIPMSASELDRHHLLQFPTLVGGVVPVVNLPKGGGAAFRLTGDVLARIFGGQITRWSDPAIAQLNPGRTLPDSAIHRVVRADNSGTTEVFASYLSVANAELASQFPRKGGAHAWPGTVQAVEGSSKVASTVKSTPGSIGYISSDYVLREGLTGVSLRNRSGEWVKPEVASFRAAVREGKLFSQSLEAAPLIDLSGTGVWPIVTATYIVVDKSPKQAAKTARTLSFFYEAFLSGDRAVAGTGFAPLPTATQARIVGLLSNLRTPDGQVIPLEATPRSAKLSTGGTMVAWTNSSKPR